jgi:hypothetical protein
MTLNIHQATAFRCDVKKLIRQGTRSAELFAVIEMLAC